MLESDRSGRLSLAKEQSPDGASLVEGICKRKAVLYIRPKHSEVYRLSIIFICIFVYKHLASYFAKLNNFKQKKLVINKLVSPCS